MNNEQTRGRVNEIYASLEVLNQELEMIRMDCSHDSYRIGNWMWRPGAFDLAKICNHCDEHIGIPSEEEEELFFDPKNPLNIQE